MSLSVIPLTILGQITGVTGSGETALYQVSFKSIDGTPLYGVTAVWTDEQAEIEALAAQKSYGVWINPVNGEFTIKFAGYTYKGSADLTDPDVLAGITPIEFSNQAAGGGSNDIIHITTNPLNVVENYETIMAMISAQKPILVNIDDGDYTGYLTIIWENFGIIRQQIVTGQNVMMYHVYELILDPEEKTVSVTYTTYTSPLTPST